MLAQVLELYPTALTEGIEEILNIYTHGETDRGTVNDRITELLRRFKRKKYQVNGLEIILIPGSVYYDTNVISVDHCCPYCGGYFLEYAATFFIIPGMNHDKYIYACLQCHRFYAVYNQREEE